MEKRAIELINKWGSVDENNKSLNPNVYRLRNNMEQKDQYLQENINVLNEDTANGGFNECVCHATNNVNAARKHGMVAFVMDIHQHCLCVVIMDGAKPVVIDSYGAYKRKKSEYKYKRFDLIDYIKKVNSEPKYSWGRGFATVNGCFAKDVTDHYAGIMQVNFALRMIVLFRLKAYIKDINDKKALYDAKNLANYICDMEKTDAIALWPVCYIHVKHSHYSSHERHYMLFPPYENLKKLLDEGKYEEYIKAELPEDLYFDLHDIVKLQNPNEEESYYSFFYIFNHLSNNKQYLFQVDADNYDKFIFDLKLKNVRSYQDYYNYIKTNKEKLPYDYSYKIPKGKYIRYTKSLWSEWDENKKLEERFNNKKSKAIVKNFHDEIQEHLLSKTINNAYGGHKKYLEDEANGLKSQINERNSKVYNPDVESL